MYKYACNWLTIQLYFGVSCILSAGEMLQGNTLHSFLSGREDGGGYLELGEGLLGTLGLGDLQGVELDGLGEGAALSHRHHIANPDVPVIKIHTMKH